ncbi:hypothetical protein Z052_15460 [Halorubrum sp. C191]|nr:hypothetical protein Z052_15460 [Halorubrum sp. C191]
MDYQNGSKLYIDTPTSGIYDRVEPVQFSRTIDIIETRDSRSDAVYNTVSTHASNTWNDTIKTVANDDNLSATDFENVTEDLSIFNVDNVDANDTDAVLSQYAGIYDSVAQPSDTRINLTNGDGTQYNEVVLFSTDLQTLMNQTDNSSQLAVNDTFNASDVSRTLVVNPDNAEVYELSGDVKIDDIVEDGESVDDVDIQTFDLLSTDLSKQANAIQESVDVTIDTVDSAQDNDLEFPPILPGGNGAGTVVVLGAVAIILYSRVL